MRAIDLYAGIGGWSLGLRLAGIDVVASYEWWQPAIDTHNGNLGGSLSPVDIRKLRLDDLPESIDLVVGSPPCTEFSYANRGGNGNLAEGLKDLVKFLEVVEHVKPKYWVFENVPRVAEVLREGLRTPGHALYRFRHMSPQIEVIDFSEFGAPQSRKRCIAGNIPLERLASFKAEVRPCTLGQVITALSFEDWIVDPVWGVILPAADLTETQCEPALNREELRMNREAKSYHPVYNNMAFPDRLAEPARTVTATCTRVSRESIVIEDPREKGQYRRLTIRERASLQGFPITYQFYAKSFSEKAKMIGNAIPPTFTYLVGLAARELPARRFSGHTAVASSLFLPNVAAPLTPPDQEGRSYPATRRFRSALPGLRFKSGMRFELANEVASEYPEWRVHFYFGTSKDTREVEFDGSIWADLRADLSDGVFSEFRAQLLKFENQLTTTSPVGLQASWCHTVNGLGPYEVVDHLGALASMLLKVFEDRTGDGLAATKAYVRAVAARDCEEGNLPNERKIERYALSILSGMIVADWFNNLDWHRPHRAAA